MTTTAMDTSLKVRQNAEIFLLCACMLIYDDRFVTSYFDDTFCWMFDVSFKNGIRIGTSTVPYQ